MTKGDIRLIAFCLLFWMGNCYLANEGNALSCIVAEVQVFYIWSTVSQRIYEQRTASN